MRHMLSLCAFLLLFMGTLHAQDYVQIGSQRFVPEQNVIPSGGGTRSGGTIDLGASSEGWHNVLVQFKSIPTSLDRSRLSERGIELGGYLGGHAYWALVKEGTAIDGEYARLGLRSVMAMEPEWRVSDPLLGGHVPEWARVGESGSWVNILYSSHVSPERVREDLERSGVYNLTIYEDLDLAVGILPLSALDRVSEIPWLMLVDHASEPMEQLNFFSTPFSRSTLLRTSPLYGGRGLDGKDVNVGILDGNVTPHVDFGTRLHVQEYGTMSTHGTHVAGTICGAGFLDQMACGVAPKANLYSYNFNTKAGGTPEAVKMKSAHDRFGIALTNNSYGRGMSCEPYHHEQYTYAVFDLLVDFISGHRDKEGRDYRYVTHVFAAGNEQSKCLEDSKEMFGAPGYGTVLQRAKNVILVGSTQPTGRMTFYSSWGPTDDGRIGPTIATSGDFVYSTVPEQGYGFKSGTSMATPLVTGTLTLLTQRFGQLNGGALMRSDLSRALLAASARDAGLPGPDFQYGFGILDAERALEVIEKEQYVYGTYSGETVSHYVTVPEGAKRVRVTLAWIDPVREKKKFAWGERSLVHDIDLTVNGQLPLFPNPKAVTTPARPTRDSLNNTEQCVLEGLTAGQKIEVQVSAVEALPHGSQDYAVVWSFEYDELSVQSPTQGQVLLADSGFVLHISGNGEPWKAEISLDGGKNYQPLLSLDRRTRRYAQVGVDKFDRLNPRHENMPVNFHSDMFKYTTQARVRVVTPSGAVAESGNFTIAGRKYVSASGIDESGGLCEAREAKLKWMQLDKFEDYDSLMIQRGDPRTGVWEDVKEIEASKREYQFEAGEYQSGYFYTVTPYYERNGVKSYGPRAVPYVQLNSRQGDQGMLMYARGSRGLKLSPSQLPHRETMRNLVDMPFGVKCAQNVVIKYSQEQYLKGIFPAGSQAIIFRTDSDRSGGSNPEVDRNKPFGNDDFLNKIYLCELDLTEFGTDEEVMLLIYTAPKSADRGQVPYRLSIEGAVVADVRGETVHRGHGFHLGQYKLPGGKTYKNLVIETIGVNKDDLWAFLGMEFRRPRKEPDVVLDVKTKPQSKNHMGREVIVTEVSNMSNAAIQEGYIELLVDNRVVASDSLKGLEAYMTKSVVFEYDFSTSDRLGKSYDVQVRCVVPGDPYPGDNVKSFVVNNLGDVYALEYGSRNSISYYFRGLPKDPAVTYRMKEGEKLIFTDGGGAYGEYGRMANRSTVKFLPHNTNNSLHAQIIRFNTDPEQSYMRIYTYRIDDDLYARGTPYKYKVSGQLENLPWDIQSEARDGGLTFHFWSEQGYSGEGWIIYIEERPRTNSISFSDVKTTLVGSEPEAKVPVRLTLKNNMSMPIKDVLLCYSTLDTIRVCKTLSFDAGEVKKDFLLDEIPHKLSTIGYIDVWTEHEQDMISDDNWFVGVTVYDPWPVPDRYEELFFKGQTNYWVNYQVRGISNGYGSGMKFGYLPHKERFRNGWLRYEMHDTVELYKDLGRMQIYLDSLVAHANIRVKLYLDSVGKGDFSFIGEIKGTNETNDFGYPEIVRDSILLKGIDKMKLGPKRARLIIAREEDDVDPAKGNLTRGGLITDFMFNVVSTNPLNDDLEVHRVQWLDKDGNPVKQEAFALDALPETPKFRLSMRTGRAGGYDGKFSVRLSYRTPDGEVEEVVELNAKDKKLPHHYSGVAEFDVAFTESLASVVKSLGEHRVTATLVADLGDLAKSANNVGSASIFTWADKSGGHPYALTFNTLEKSSQEPRLHAYTPRLPEEDQIKLDQSFGSAPSMVLEFWFYPLENQDGVILSKGDDFRVSVVNRGGLHRYRRPVYDDTVKKDDLLHELPGACIMVESHGDLRNSTANSIEFNRWNHVVIVHEEIKKAAAEGRYVKKATRIYINGVNKYEEPKNHKAWNPGYAYVDLSELEIGASFNGMVDGVRYWRHDPTKHSLSIPKMYENYETVPAAGHGSETPGELIYQMRLDAGPGNQWLPTLRQDGAVQAGGRILGDAGVDLKAGLKSAKEGGIWRDLTEPFPFTFKLDGKDLVTQYDAAVNLYTVYVDKNLSGLELEILGPWPNEKIILEGNEYSGGPFDFAPEKEYSLVSEAPVWGQTLKSAAKLRVVQDNSKDFSLLTLSVLKSDNPGLEKDFEYEADEDNPVPSTIDLVLSRAPEHPEAVKVNYTLPAGPTLYMGGRAQTSPVTVDLRKPVLLTVRSVTGQDQRNYRLKLSVDQSITWAPEVTEFEYGSDPVEVTAKSTSGEALGFTSSDPNTAEVRDMKLHLWRPGTSEVQAFHPGSGMYAPAISDAHLFTVKPVRVTVKPVFPKEGLLYGDKASRVWNYEYTGLLTQRESFQLPDPQSKLTWEFWIQDGTGRRFEYNDRLPVGTYRVKPTKESYDAGSFTVDALETEVVVRGNAEYTDVHVRVVNADGTENLSGMMVIIGDLMRRTDEAGEALFRARPDREVTAEVIDPVGKYVQRLVTFKTGGTHQVVIVPLQRGAVTVTYKAGRHGQVVGRLRQALSRGGSTEAVLAMPDPGYAFEKWSDGVTTAERYDVNVTEAKTVIANFKRKTVTIKYAISGEGQFVSGTGGEEFLTQTGYPGDEIEKVVKVEPKDVGKYYFVAWDDDFLKSDRTGATFPQEDATITAIFAEYQSLPYVETFEGNGLNFPQGWYAPAGTFSNPNVRWSMVDHRIVVDAHGPSTIASCLFGTFAYIPTVGKMKDTGTNLRATLYTARYKLDGVSSIGGTHGSHLRLGLKYFLGNAEHPVHISYRTEEEGAWQDFHFSLDTGSYLPESAVKTIPFTTLSGKEWIQFRIELRNNSVYGMRAVGIDDFSLQASNSYAVSDESSQVVVRYRCEPSEGGQLYTVKRNPLNRMAKPVYKKVTTQYGSIGKRLLPVVSDAKPGYKFSHWEGHPELLGDTIGAMTLELKHKGTEFVAVFVKSSMARVRYTAWPAEGGQVLYTDGTLAGQELVDLAGTGSKEGKSVKAVAKPGYKFAYWNMDGSTTPEFKLKEVTRNTEVVAYFEPLEQKAELTVYSYTADEEGNRKPLPGALIEVYDVDNNLVTMLGTVPSYGAEGAVENASALFRLSAGEYRVKTSFADWAPVEEKVVLSSGGTLTHMVTLMSGQQKYGVVFRVKSTSGSAVAGAVVRIGDKEYTTDASGKVTVPMRPGRFTYQVNAVGFVGQPERWLSVVAEAGQEVNVVLVKGTEVVFTVVIEQEQTVPVVGAMVIVAGVAGVTDEAGRFSVGVAEADGVKFRVLPADPRQFKEGDGTLQGGGERIERKVMLRENYFDLEITVLDAVTRKPVEGVTVRHLNREGVTGTTDAEGTVRFELPVRDHRFFFGDKEGYDYVAVMTVPTDFRLVQHVQLLSPKSADPSGPSVNAVSEELLAGVRVMPNPVEDYLYLVDAARVTRVEVLSITGVCVYAEDLVGNESVSLDLSHLTEGVYLVRLSGEGAQRVVRIVKR